MSDKKIIKNCLMCTDYECESLYKYVYDFNNEKKKPLILETDGYCFTKKDTDSHGNIIENFDRTIERSCCTLSIFQTAIIDKELQKATNIEELRELFNQKYLKDES